MWEADLSVVIRSANLDEAVTGPESLQHAGPKSAVKIDERDAPTIADPHPTEASVGAS